jgi:hypothetical protein
MINVYIAASISSCIETISFWAPDYIIHLGSSCLVITDIDPEFNDEYLLATLKIGLNHLFIR